MGYLDQWTAYQRRAFGPLFDVLKARVRALGNSDNVRSLMIMRKVSHCCVKPQIVTVDGGVRYYLTEQRCKSRVCPRCSIMRARQLASRIAAIVHEMDSPRFLTLTVRSNHLPLADQVKRLRRRFAVLRRRPEWRSKVKSGLYTIEVTFNVSSQQWHPHLHAIIDGTYWPQAELLGHWSAVVQDHAGVDIRIVHGIRKIANYLAVYVAKSCDLKNLGSRQLAEWAVETHGLRLVQTFGSLHRCKPAVEAAEPLPTRLVEIDVNAMAYEASFGNATAETILQTLEPNRKCRPEHQDGDLMRLIHDFNNPEPRKKRRPRGRDPNQLTMLN